MRTKNQPLIRVDRTVLVAANIDRPCRVPLKPMDLNSVQTVSLHNAFKVGDGMLVRGVGIPNPPVEVADGTVGSTGSAGRIISDEIDPFVHISSVDPPIAGAHTICISQIST